MEKTVLEAIALNVYVKPYGLPGTNKRMNEGEWKAVIYLYVVSSLKSSEDDDASCWTSGWRKKIWGKKMRKQSERKDNLR